MSKMERTWDSRHIRKEYEIEEISALVVSW